MFFSSMIIFELGVYEKLLRTFDRGSLSVLKNMPWQMAFVQNNKQCEYERTLQKLSQIVNLDNILLSSECSINLNLSFKSS